MRRARYLDTDGAARKQMPLCTGVLDYFPDALALVAEISYLGNEKHNPGEPLHHARGKSMDHADCIMRHLAERGGRDPQGIRHSAQLAWRALALLQEELEAEFGFGLPRGARYDETRKVDSASIGSVDDAGGDQGGAGRAGTEVGRGVQNSDLSDPTELEWELTRL